ncbi:hypothetical protein FKM82_025841 [Ascaphus truei]
MDLIAYTVIGISCLIFLWGVKNFYMRGNLPPGPTPLPVLGNILQIKRGQLVTYLKEMRLKYGDVFTVYLGSRPVVVVSGYQAVKAALVDYGYAFSGRGETPCFDAAYKNFGFAFTSNMERWNQLRRFSLTTLRDFGMGKRSIEDRIQEEAECLVTELRKTKESAFDPSIYLSRASCNIICSITFGKRFEYNEEAMQTMIHMIHDSFQLISSTSGQMYDMFPGFMKYLPGKHNKIFKHLQDLLSFIDKMVQINQKTLDPSSPRDYIDAFLIRMEKEKHNPNTEFNMNNLVCCALQIFFAGTETTSTTLTYGFLLLLKYPEVQGKKSRKRQGLTCHLVSLLIDF